VENSHKTLLLDEGADVTIVGMKFDDMTFTELVNAGEVRIASAAGVPPIVAGLQGGLDASTMANYAAAYRNFADSAMHPAWRGACQSLGKFLTVPDGAELWFDTRDIPALRDAEMDRQKGNAQLSIAAMNLVNAGYDPDTVVTALVSGDMSLLKHTGLVSVQLIPPGANEPAGENPEGGTT
jgi:phage portal protein BeeE